MLLVYPRHDNPSLKTACDTEKYIEQELTDTRQWQVGWYPFWTIATSWAVYVRFSVMLSGIAIYGGKKIVDGVQTPVNGGA